MLHDFKTDHKTVLEKLSRFPREEYIYLKALVFEVNDIDVSLSNNTQLQERFIVLACDFEPDIVYSFIRTHEAYHLDRMMDLTKSKGIVGMYSCVYLVIIRCYCTSAGACW